MVTLWNFHHVCTAPCDGINLRQPSAEWDTCLTCTFDSKMDTVFHFFYLPRLGTIRISLFNCWWDYQTDYRVFLWLSHAPSCLFGFQLNILWLIIVQFATICSYKETYHIVRMKTQIGLIETIINVPINLDKINSSFIV